MAIIYYDYNGRSSPDGQQHFITTTTTTIISTVPSPALFCDGGDDDDQGSLRIPDRFTTVTARLIKGGNAAQTMYDISISLSFIQTELDPFFFTAIPM